MDSKPGMYSSTKPLLERDKSMVKRVLKGVQLKRPNPVQAALIRRHFLELTQTFMIPLERYLASLMPLAKNISPYRAAPQVINATLLCFSFIVTDNKSWLNAIWHVFPQLCRLKLLTPMTFFDLSSLVGLSWCLLSKETGKDCTNDSLRAPTLWAGTARGSKKWRKNFSYFTWSHLQSHE